LNLQITIRAKVIYINFFIIIKMTLWIETLLNLLVVHGKFLLLNMVVWELFFFFLDFLGRGMAGDNVSQLLFIFIFFFCNLSFIIFWLYVKGVNQESI
jgi:hypothetical protein